MRKIRQLEREKGGGEFLCCKNIKRIFLNFNFDFSFKFQTFTYFDQISNQRERDFNYQTSPSKIHSTEEKPMGENDAGTPSINLHDKRISLKKIWPILSPFNRHNVVIEWRLMRNIFECQFLGRCSFDVRACLSNVHHSVYCHCMSEQDDVNLSKISLWTIYDRKSNKAPIVNTFESRRCTINIWR